MEIICEIGSNWKRASARASYTALLQHVSAAATSGATVVKVQLFNADRLYSKQRALKQWSIAEQHEFPLEWLSDLHDFAKECNVKLWASVFDTEIADKSIAHLDGVKIASGDIINYALIKHVFKLACERQIDFAISTGASTVKEVEKVFNYLQPGNKHPARLFVFHCVSTYPAESNDYNMSSINVLTRFGIVGLSDHTEGIDQIMIGMAVGLGCRAFEKHFATSFDIVTPDSSVSITPKDLRFYSDSINDAVELFGSGGKRPMECEVGERVWARRGKDGLRPANDE